MSFRGKYTSTSILLHLLTISQTTRASYRATTAAALLSYSTRKHCRSTYKGDHEYQHQSIYSRTYTSLTKLKNNPSSDSTTSNVTVERTGNLNNINMKSFHEIILQCSDGVQLAGKQWSIQKSKEKNSLDSHKILCLHGWLDNASSFNYMVSNLSTHLEKGQLLEDQQRNVEIVALDFPGHGHSSHKSSDGPTSTISEYAFYVAEALRSLKWSEIKGSSKSHLPPSSSSVSKEKNGITLIGHSMGAAVSVMFAAAFPELVDRVILLEGTGPLARKSNDVSDHLRQSITKRVSANRTIYPQFSNLVESNETNNEEPNKHKKNSRKKMYTSLDAAIDARMKTATLTPGEQYISREAATALVCRAAVKSSQQINQSQAGGEELDLADYNGPVYFRHDARLLWPSLQYFTHEQVKSLLQDVQCPICLITAEDGWPVDTDQAEETLNILQPTIHKLLPGSHHFHADPQTAPDVVNEIHRFLQSEWMN